MMIFRNLIVNTKFFLIWSHLLTLVEVKQNLFLHSNHSNHSNHSIDVPKKANPRVLEPLLKIGKLLSESEYNEQITPSVVKWFANPDRNLRMNLLQNMDFFVEHLNQNVIENQIFPHIVFKKKKTVMCDLTPRSK